MELLRIVSLDSNARQARVSPVLVGGGIAGLTFAIEACPAMLIPNGIFIDAEYSVTAFWAT